MDYEQYLRKNLMPTKSVDNDNYHIVECYYEFVRIDEMKHYEILKSELDEVEKELKNNMNMSYKDYEDLNKRKVELLQKIDECPLIYEIWHDDYDGSKSCRLTKQSLEYRYMNKEKAYIKLDELNDGRNYGRPYYMKIRELDG